jgi:hypothetical protein
MTILKREGQAKTIQVRDERGRSEGKFHGGFGDHPVAGIASRPLMSSSRTASATLWL